MDLKKNAAFVINLIKVQIVNLTCKIQWRWDRCYRKSRKTWI